MDAVGQLGSVDVLVQGLAGVNEQLAGGDACIAGDVAHVFFILRGKAGLAPEGLAVPDGGKGKLFNAAQAHFTFQAAHRVVAQSLTALFRVDAQGQELCRLPCDAAAQEAHAFAPLHQLAQQHILRRMHQAGAEVGGIQGRNGQARIADKALRHAVKERPVAVPGHGKGGKVKHCVVLRDV